MAYAIYSARHCCPHTGNNLVGVVHEVLRGVAYHRSNIVATKCRPIFVRDVGVNLYDFLLIFSFGGKPNPDTPRM